MKKEPDICLIDRWIFCVWVLSLSGKIWNWCGCGQQQCVPSVWASLILSFSFSLLLSLLTVYSKLWTIMQLPKYRMFEYIDFFLIASLLPMSVWNNGDHETTNHYLVYSFIQLKCIFLKEWQSDHGIFYDLVLTTMGINSNS